MSDCPNCAAKQNRIAELRTERDALRARIAELESGHTLRLTEEQVGALRKFMRSHNHKGMIATEWAALDSLLRDQVDPLFASIHGPEE